MATRTWLWAAVLGLTLASAASASAKPASREAREARQEAQKHEAEAHQAKRRTMIEDFSAASEEKRARQESRWNERMNEFGRPNDQRDRWTLF
jgi:hypothetical protein